MIMVYSILDNMQDNDLSLVLRSSVDRYIDTPRSELSTFYSGVFSGQLIIAFLMHYLTKAEYDCISHDVAEYYDNKYPNYNQKKQGLKSV